jgi:hypothetical protein
MGQMGPGMMGQMGQGGPMMGPGMMGQGMAPGMMGPGQAPGMMGQMGQMGPGMMGPGQPGVMMGPGMMGQPGMMGPMGGLRVTPSMHLTTDDVSRCAFRSTPTPGGSRT